MTFSKLRHPSAIRSVLSQHHHSLCRFAARVYTNDALSNVHCEQWFAFPLRKTYSKCSLHL
jgi:hypothetical protein